MNLIGWNKITGTSCHKTLKASINNMSDTAVREHLKQCNEGMKTEKGKIISHHITSAFYCVAKMNYGKA